MLILSNQEFDISQTEQNITSKEAKELYLTCSELMVARRFAKNNIDKDDAVAIMDFADAYSVLSSNEQAKGICLANIANIHFRNKKYSKATKNYFEAAECARKLFEEAKANFQTSEYNKYVYVYCKRKYYQTICAFHELRHLDKQATENQWTNAERGLAKIKKLIIKRMKSADDLLIMCHLYSSYCCMMTKRLISADNDLKDAQDTFKRRRKIEQKDRPDIPIIPSCILLQRIYLMRGLLHKAYGKNLQAFMIFTKLLKIGHIYDPKTRMEALTQLDIILEDSKFQTIRNNPSMKNIKLMLELFRKDKVKDIILLVDSHMDNDPINRRKVTTLLEIFDTTTAKDRLSLITISRKVNVIYSLSQKSKNTTQLRNQLSNVSWDKTARCNYVKGIHTGLNELTQYANQDTDSYIL